MDNRQSVLFVDDEPNILRSYRRTLREFSDRWDMEFDSHPETAWRRIQIESFDAVVCDMRMPGMTGLQLLERIKSNPATANIPVVIVTGNADVDLKRRALDLDATDLLNKPVESSDLIARIKSALRMKKALDELGKQKERLEHQVVTRTKQLAASRENIIWRLAKAAEFRDEETGNHVIRVACYSRIVAKKLGMDEKFCNEIFLAAPLHDIGKIGIPDDILLKPGKLDDEDWQIMKRHCEIGVSILSDECTFGQFAHSLGEHDPLASTSERSDGIQESDGVHRSILNMAVEIAGCHHEHWDGNGYPNRQQGNSIPLAARIVAVADVYDALRSRRPYKEPFTMEQALAIIEDGSGTQFDPQVVSAFLQAFEHIARIERALGDEADPNEADAKAADANEVTETAAIESDCEVASDDYSKSAISDSTAAQSSSTCCSSRGLSLTASSNRSSRPQLSIDLAVSRETVA